MDENGKIRCVAIDDEPLALEVIDKFCRRMGGTELHTFSDPARAMQMIADERPDIVFLDIEMENVSGLDLASQMPDNTCVIFTTAFPDYALKGFELDAVDYLHKPFAYDRFKTAIAKAMRRIAIHRPLRMPNSIFRLRRNTTMSAFRSPRFFMWRRWRVM